MPGRQPDCGIPLWEAIERWTPEPLWRRYQELDYVNTPLVNLWDPVQQETAKLRDKMERVLIGKLQRGELLASGIALPLQATSRRHDISPELWTRLKLSIRKQEASGDGLTIVELLFRARKGTGPDAERGHDIRAGDAAAVRPGRPSIMRMIEAEMRRRATLGLIERSSLREAEALVAWAEQEFADAHVPKPKSIQKKLGRLYRELRAPKKGR